MDLATAVLTKAPRRAAWQIGILFRPLGIIQLVKKTLAHTVSPTCDQVRLAGEACLLVRTTRTRGAQNRGEEVLGETVAAASQALFGQALPCWLYVGQYRNAVLWPRQCLNLWPGVPAAPGSTLAVQAQSRAASRYDAPLHLWGFREHSELALSALLKAITPCFN